MKPSEVSRNLEEAKKKGRLRRQRFSGIVWFPVFVGLVVRNWWSDAALFACVGALVTGSAIIAISDALRRNRARLQAQDLALSKAYAEAAQTLMKQFHFRDQETLAHVLIAWAGDAMAHHRWSDACDILIAVRRNLSRGFDSDRLMIDEANCIAHLGRTNEAQALLIVAQAQSKSPLIRIKAEKMLSSLGRSRA